MGNLNVSGSNIWVEVIWLNRIYLQGIMEHRDSWVEGALIFNEWKKTCQMFNLTLTTPYQFSMHSSILSKITEGAFWSYLPRARCGGAHVPSNFSAVTLNFLECHHWHYREALKHNISSRVRRPCNNISKQRTCSLQWSINLLGSIIDSPFYKCTIIHHKHEAVAAGTWVVFLQ
jgi:hypothetical protein